MAGKGVGGLGGNGAGGLGRPTLLLVFLLLLAVPAAAQQARPKTILLLASGLSLDDLRRGGPLPHVRQLAEEGGVALLNAAVAGPANEAAAFLSVGGGERLAAPDENAAAEVFAPDARTPEGEDARRVYRRRFGAEPPVPNAALLHLGLPALQRAQPTPARAAQIGSLGDALRAAGRSAAALGDGRAALVLTDRRGVVPHGALGGTATPEQMMRALGQADVVAIVAPDAPTLDRLAGAALPLARSGEAHVVVATLAPEGTRGRIGFLAAAGPGIAARSLLVSPTTRTPGLIANVDIAPSVLRWQQADFGGGAGRAVRAEPARDAWAVVSRLDRQLVATQNATVPVLVGYGAFAIGAGLAALLALLGNRAIWVRAARFALLLAAAALLAFLPVGVLAPRAAWAYGAAVAGTSALLAVLATLLGRRLGVPPLGVLLTGAAITIAADAVCGSPLVSRTLFSGYLPGIRFYGVGNEYMGLTVGAALVGPLLGPHPPTPSPRLWERGRKERFSRGAQPEPVGQLAPPLPQRGRGGWGVRALWLAVLLALGLPFWGADAGGALAATVTFLTAFFALRVERLRAGHVAAAFAAAFAVTLAFAFLDRALPAAERSHAGAAIAAGQERGLGAIWEIAARKVRMNVGIALTPGTLGALAGLTPIWWLLARGPLGARAAAALHARPRLRRVLPAAASGALAALAFNDSGVVAALLLLAPPTGALIDGMLCDSLP